MTTLKQKEKGPKKLHITILHFIKKKKKYIYIYIYVPPNKFLPLPLHIQAQIEWL